MFKKIINIVIAKLYHYGLAVNRRMYAIYIADKHVFSGGGKFKRKDISIQQTC